MREAEDIILSRNKHYRSTGGLMFTFIVLLLFVNNYFCIAQADSINSRQIDRIIVIARKPLTESAITVTAIDSASFRESANNTLAELLARHSPVFVKTYGQGSLATVSFRGTSASHTQVQWNGLNINNPMLGQVDFTLIPVWFVDRAEILHGGSSLTEGSGALGGTISTASVADWDKRLGITAVQGFGSFGLYQTFVGAEGGNRKIHGNFRYLYETSDNDFQFYNTSVLPHRKTVQQNAEYSRHGALADIFYNDGKGNILSANCWFLHNDRNLPWLMSYEGAERKEWQKDNEVRTALGWKHYGKKLKTELTVGHIHSSTRYFLANPTILGMYTGYDTHSRTHSVQGRFIAQYSFSENTVVRMVFNAAYHHVTNSDTTRSTNPTEQGFTAKRNQYGISASLHHNLGKGLAAYILLREDLTDGGFSPLMPSAGVEFSPEGDPGAVLKLNATRNYHQPTLNDLYWHPGGNPGLLPEKGFTTDLTAGYSADGGNWNYKAEITGYFSWIDDWIVWMPGINYYWSAENIDKVFSRGIEVSAGAGFRYTDWDFSLTGNYSYTRTTNERNYNQKTLSERQLVYIPVHKAGLMLDSRWKKWYLMWVWTATGMRYTTSSREDSRFTLPAYELHDVTVGRRVHFAGIGLDMRIQVNNIFGRAYQAIQGRAMPGQNYNIIIKFNF